MEENKYEEYKVVSEHVAERQGGAVVDYSNPEALFAIEERLLGLAVEHE